MTARAEGLGKYDYIWLVGWFVGCRLFHAESCLYIYWIYELLLGKNYKPELLSLYTVKWFQVCDTTNSI